METQRSKMNMESSESPTHSLPNTNTNTNTTPPEIPIEIVGEEEMALIESALALASTRFSTQLLHKNTRSIRSISILSKRGLLTSSTDIEDHGGKNIQQQKRFRLNESLLHRFRRKRGLFVTDITASVRLLFFLLRV